MKTVTLTDAMSLKTLKGYYIAKAAHYSILKTLYFMSLIWQRNIFARNGSKPVLRSYDFLLRLHPKVPRQNIHFAH